MTFLLAFGTEAVVLVEIGMTTYRTANFNPERNDEHLINNLDMLEEKRDGDALRIAANKNQMVKYYNLQVKPRRFAIGYLLLRKVSLVTQDPTDGKLGPS